jgi:GT2 family glycosyltransferase
LDALLSEEYPRLDITVVDNGSADGSAEWILDRHSDVRLHRFFTNQGFSRALNWGIDHTDGELVLSLNPDVTIETGFVLETVRAMCQHERVGAVAPKLLRANDPRVLDSTGLFVDRRRRPYDRGQAETDRNQYNAQLRVFGACGAAALYRRAMLKDLMVEGECFDEDFFAYYEDADLAWRARLRGWSCVYAPRAVARHVRGWGDTLRKKGHAAKDATGPRLALRNRYLMTIKNDALRYFLADLPWILAAEMPRLVYAALTVPTVLYGLWDLIRAWPSARQKRRWIRSHKTVSDDVVRRWFVDPTKVALERRC